jgi:hypothetical protein
MSRCWRVCRHDAVVQKCVAHELCVANNHDAQLFARKPHQVFVAIEASKQSFPAVAVARSMAHAIQTGLARMMFAPCSCRTMILQPDSKTRKSALITDHVYSREECQKLWARRQPSRAALHSKTIHKEICLDGGWSEAVEPPHRTSKQYRA